MFFFCYKDAQKLRPLCIFLQKMSVYRRDFDETKYMTFLIKDDELLKNIMKFGEKSAITSNLVHQIYFLGFNVLYIV